MRGLGIADVEWLAAVDDDVAIEVFVQPVVLDRFLDAADNVRGSH